MALYTHTARKEGNLMRFELKDADRIVASGTGPTASAAQQEAGGRSSRRPRPAVASQRTTKARDPVTVLPAASVNETFAVKFPECAYTWTDVALFPIPNAACV